MITAKQVAERLGIAVSTVGRAMAGDPRISAQTQLNVKKMADEMGYVGNTAARVMRGGSSKLIGLLIPDITNDFYATIAQALSQCCDAEGYRVVLSIHNDDRDVELRHIKELAAARVAGIMIVPSAAPRKESIAMLRGLPHAQLLRCLPSLDPVFFGTNDEAALYEATAHLLALGHRRIAYIGGAEALSTGAARVAGYRHALKDHGYDSSSELEMLGVPTHTFGRECTLQLLNQKTPPTAVVTGSIHVAMGMVDCLQTKNISIPGDLSVIGFGDPLWFSWWRNGLTTVRPPIQELATSCGLWFLHYLRTSPLKRERPTYQAVSSSTLVVRGSTSPHSP